MLNSPSDPFHGYVSYFLQILLQPGEDVVCVGRLVWKLGMKTCVSHIVLWYEIKLQWYQDDPDWVKQGTFKSRKKLFCNTFYKLTVLQWVSKGTAAKSRWAVSTTSKTRKIIGVVYLLVIDLGFRGVYHLIKSVFSIVFNSILNQTGKQYHNQRQHSNLPVEDFYLWEPVYNQ